MITQTHPNYDGNISLGKKWLIERDPCGFTCTSCAVHISQCNRCNSCADCTKTMGSAPFPAYIHGSMVGYQWCTCDLGENPNNLKADTQDDNPPTYISHSVNIVFLLFKNINMKYLVLLTMYDSNISLKLLKIDFLIHLVLHLLYEYKFVNQMIRTY